VNPYEIRPATSDDLAVLLHHRRRMFEEMGFNDPAAMEAMLTSSTPLLKRGLIDGTYRAWLAEASTGGIVAGGGVILLEFLSHPIDPLPRRAWVVNIYTEPEHRRRGLARRVMETMVAWCRAEGMGFLYLHASDDGRPLYDSLGFKLSNEMRLAL
jgi:GNAT superfamily N-acetyltransferase